MSAIAHLSMVGIGCRLPTLPRDGRSESGLLILLALIAASACANAGAGGTVPTAATESPLALSAPAEIEFGVGEARRIPPVTLTFVRVSQDSRCPTGVTCIWAGDAVAELRVERDGAAPEVVSLHTNAGSGQAASVAGLSLRLVRLEPYPEADHPIAAGDYRLVLSVTNQ